AGVAEKRVEELRKHGYKDAQLYGADPKGDLGGLNAFFLLLGKPALYGLPEKPKLPQRNVLVDSLLSIGSALVVGLGALVAFRGGGGGGAGGGGRVPGKRGLAGSGWTPLSSRRFCRLGGSGWPRPLTSP